MSALSVADFLDLLRKSELVEQKTLDQTLADAYRDAPDAFVDARLLVGVLIKRGAITGWQARQLLKGKYKGFFLRQYKILGHLGSGGMSAVYLAEHTVMKRRVAVKVLPKRKLTAVYVERFMREAQAIASLDHPHIVRAYDVDRFEDVHYIVMEYFEGKNLRKRVEKNGPLAYEDAANFIRQAALGLEHAHQAGIVHRDVKPENILVDDRNFVKILDLGLALLDESIFSAGNSSFDEDKILGTADYLAPEQALDSHSVDARADVYGLGATLYFCLTGSPPFPTGTIMERLLAHQRKEPPSVFGFRPDAPADLVEICSIMMEKKPENRFQSARQVVEAMELWLIRSGFATPSEFSRGDDETSEDAEDDEFSNLFGDKIFAGDEAERRFLENGARLFEIGAARGESNGSASTKNGSKKSGAEGVVDLFDGSEASSARRRGATTIRRAVDVPSDEVVLTRRAPDQLDPLEIALNEIAADVKNSGATPPDPPRPAPPRPPQIVESNAASKLPTEPERRSGGWVRDVPVWFWAVAVGGYAFAVFLAGILVSLLAK